MSFKITQFVKTPVYAMTVRRQTAILVFFKNTSTFLLPAKANFD